MDMYCCRLRSSIHFSAIFLYLLIVSAFGRTQAESWTDQLSLDSDENITKDILPPPDLDGKIISKDPNTIGFYLYSDPKNQTYYETLVLGDSDSVQKSSHFNINLPVIFLIHGFLTSFKDSFIQSVKNAYLSAQFPANIIGVDWGEMATPKAPAPYFHYQLAVNNVPVVAKRVSKFIMFLLEIHAVKSTEDIHIVGFSLGAHVSGIAGYRLIMAGVSPIGRITGLDPAAPAYQLQPNENKLDSTDARFVDIVHTNQGLKGYLGVLGHVDFFPNGGGPTQPGCSNATDFSDVFTSVCSHARAYVYFIQSILNPDIIACKCTSALVTNMAQPDEATRTFVNAECKANCVEPITFGQYCPTSARGIYYLSIQA